MSKIRKSAKGQDCTVRIPGICNFMPETTVLAHINGGGMGTKHSDIEAAYCCSSCHDVIDSRAKCSQHQWAQIKVWHHEGAMRTRKILLDKGLIVIT